MQHATRKDILVVRHTIIKICIESSSIGGEERSEGVERSVTIIPHLGGQESRFKKNCPFQDNHHLSRRARVWVEAERSVKV